MTLLGTAEQVECGARKVFGSQTDTPGLPVVLVVEDKALEAGSRSMPIAAGDASYTWNTYLLGSGLCLLPSERCAPTLHKGRLPLRAPLQDLSGQFGATAAQVLPAAPACSARRPACSRPA
jgi:hypothetical protein